MSESGELTACRSADRTAWVWSFNRAESVGEPLRGHKDAVTSVAVSCDGQRVFSGLATRQRGYGMDLVEAR